MDAWLRGVLLLIVIAAVAVAVGYVNLRLRTRSIRRRDVPPTSLWLKEHSPHATKDEAEVVEIVLHVLAEIAEVEPTQLLPDDRLEGFVLDSRRGGADDWRRLRRTLARRLAERKPSASTPLAGRSDRSWKTVRDAIETSIARACKSAGKTPLSSTTPSAKPKTPSMRATAPKRATPSQAARRDAPSIEAVADDRNRKLLQ